MKDIRIGNDINVRWSIFSEGVPFILDGRDISVYLRTPFGKGKIEQFIILDNVIEWTFPGKQQKYLGKHSLTLVINEDADGMITTDACDFVNLVKCSCQAHGADDSGVQTEVVALTSNLEYVANVGGGGSYEDIKKDISDLKANDALQDTKLAKLSARVDNLEEGCLHRATYGVDTYDEVKALWEAGKHVICSYNGIDYLLSVVYETQIFFNAVNGYTSYRVFVNSNNVWGKQSYQLEQTSNKTTTISESSTDTQYPSAKAVYDATQKMMPATPSGDPMHYMFEAAGATYNATDADIPMVGMYGDSYVHKAKHWHLNELGDLTTQEIREIYASRYPCTAWNKNTQLYFSSFPFRTNMSDARTSNAGLALLNTFSSCKCKNIIINSKVYSLGINNMTYVFIYANNLEKILNELNVSSISTIGDSFRYLYKLKEVRLKGLKGELNIKESNLLSNASILFMIQNEAAVSAITITLHADAYDRAMADAEITAALAAHPNVSLAKA